MASWAALTDTERSLVRKALIRVQELQRIVLKGLDLKLISAADIVNDPREQFMFEVIEHDVWIATHDEKLYEFCWGPLARFVDTHEDLKGIRYWKDTIDLQMQRIEARYVTVDRARELDDIVTAAFNMIQLKKARADLASTFSSLGHAEMYFLSRRFSRC